MQHHREFLVPSKTKALLLSSRLMAAGLSVDRLPYTYGIKVIARGEAADGVVEQIETELDMTGTEIEA